MTRFGELRSIWTDAGGWRMHARASTDPVPADAPAVVLVHGLGLSGRYMVPVARHLARHYRVFAPDLPGFGDSEKPRRALDVPELGDALAAWIRATGLGRAVPLGNSFGWRRLLITFRHQIRDRIEDKLPEIGAPVLVVRGSLDPICDEAWAEEVAQHLPRGRLVLIPGVAHTLCYTAPIELADVCRPFLDEARPDRHGRMAVAGKVR